VAKLFRTEKADWDRHTQEVGHEGLCEETLAIGAWHGANLSSPAAARACDSKRDANVKTPSQIPLAGSTEANWVLRLRHRGVEAREGGLLTDRGNFGKGANSYRHAQDLDILLLRHFGDFTIGDDPERKEESGEG
jgi:hypothetical protein